MAREGSGSDRNDSVSRRKIGHSLPRAYDRTGAVRADRCIGVDGSQSQHDITEVEGSCFDTDLDFIRLQLTLRIRCPFQSLDAIACLQLHPRGYLFDAGSLQSLELCDVARARTPCHPLAVRI